MDSRIINEERFDQLIKDINVDDPLQMIIRAHLNIEASLIKLIELSLENKNHIDVARLRFPTKVDLAFALGSIADTNYKNILKNVNRLRNKFAHNLSYELTDADLNAILQEDDILKSFIESKFKDRDYLDKLRGTLAMIFLSLDAEEEMLLREKDPTSQF